MNETFWGAPYNAGLGPGPPPGEITAVFEVESDWQGVVITGTACPPPPR